MDRQEFVAVVEESWRGLDAAIAGLDDAILAEPGVVEAWSIADLLGHVTAWEHMALRHLEQGRRGETPVGLAGSSVDAYNASESAHRHVWAPAQIVEEATATREQLRQSLQSLVDEQWAMVLGEGDRQQSLGDWVGSALGGPLGPGTHAAEHAQHIQVWRAARLQRSTAQLATLVEGRRELLRAVVRVPAGDLTQEGPSGEWPVNAMLAHIAAWDRQMTRCIAAWLSGTTPPEPTADDDAFNAQVAKQARTQPVAEILLNVAQAHDDLLALVQEAQGRSGEFQYPEGVRGDLQRAVDDSAAHDRAHAAELLAQRARATA